MARDTKVNGKKTNNMEKAMKLGTTELLIKVHTLMERNTGKVTSFGGIRVNILDSLRITTSKATVYTNGVMVEFTKGPGRTIKWKVRVYLIGQMVESM